MFILPAVLLQGEKRFDDGGRKKKKEFFFLLLLLSFNWPFDEFRYDFSSSSSFFGGKKKNEGMKESGWK